jgi:glycosyltransferase involved in cell wall biosynthesis
LTKDGKIENYINSEFQYERVENERLECERLRLERSVTGSQGFIHRKFQEFCWTVQRFCRLADLSDEPAATPPIITNARKNPHLFPAAAPSCTGGYAPAGHRLLIDVTETLSSPFTSGIQRTVRELANTVVESRTGIPVFIQDGRLFSYLKQRAVPEEIEIANGDKFIMADRSWDDIPSYLAAMKRVTDNGGTNILVLHDIIPLTYPTLYPRDFYPDTARNHADWFNKIVVKADVVVAVSKSVAEDFLAYVAANKIETNPNLRIGWNYFGADFTVEADESLSTRVLEICSSATPFFLSVGTLEPRKGVRIVLDAVDRLWASGAEFRYVVTGHYGYCCRSLLRRMNLHPGFGRRLFWLDYASNAELRHLYKHARSLIFPSVAEGFGRPLVEAAHFGLPVIASDIPVFRELGGDAITYFDVADDEHLAIRIQEALVNPKTQNTVPVVTWQAATDKLLRTINTLCT